MRALVLCCLALPFLPASAMAQGAETYPGKPIRMVVPFNAGSVTDTLARVVANKLGETWSQPIIVDNRAGADGNIGTGYVASAEHDGYYVYSGGSAELFGGTSAAAPSAGAAALSPSAAGAAPSLPSAGAAASAAGAASGAGSGRFEPCAFR